MRFEWNARKASRNLRKHGVAFDEATTVFGDTLSVTIADPDHSIEEDRFVTIGWSARSRMIVVVHVDDDEEDTVRIVSARRAVPKERRIYEEGV
jgi:uncharacterized DUF497 family protein